MLKFWTAQYRYPGSKRLDISVKGNDPIGKFFAPTWEMLNEYKNNETPEGEQKYIAQYHKIIQANIHKLEELLKQDEVVLVCFCAVDKFCHRHLLTHYLKLMGAQYMGEIKDFSKWQKPQKGIINDFKKPGYEFLSNFYPAPFTYLGIYYPTTEHFYQAWKFYGEERVLVASLKTPAEAKKYGRKALKNLAWNWDTAKVEVMKVALKQKFMIPHLADKLIATGDATIIEGNYWHDNFWGSCSCDKCIEAESKNTLGILLMEQRAICKLARK